MPCPNLVDSLHLENHNLVLWNHCRSPTNPPSPNALMNGAAPVWQRNYHDHIIRDEGDLNAIRAYIDTNPARWAEDHEFALDKPEWNRPK